MNSLQNANLSAVWQKNLNAQGLTVPKKVAELIPTQTEEFVSSGLTEAKSQVFPQSVPTAESTPAKFVPTKEPSGEMADMLANMQEAETRYLTHGNNTASLIQAENRSTATCLAQFEDISLPSQEYSPSLDGVLANLMAKSQEEKKSEGHHDAPHTAHKPHVENGHLGAHLGLEATELKAQALELKSHAIEIKSQALQLKAEAINAKSELASQAVSHMQNTAGDGLDNTISQVVHGGMNAHGVEATDTGGEIHGAANELAHHGMSTGMQVATGLIGGMSGILGIFMLKHGWKEIKEGRKHKDVEHAIEGGNSMVVGTRSVAAGFTAAGHLVHGSGVLGAIGSVAQSTLTPLGVIHGAVDAGIGIKDVAIGIKTKDAGKIRKGTLGTGLGTCLILSAVGGGIPAIVGAGVFLVGKVANSIYDTKQKAKALEQAQAQLPTDQPPVTNPEHH
jgi:hypothetical protein